MRISAAPAEEPCALAAGQAERAVEELRLRVMHPLTVLTGEGELNAAPDGIASLVKAEDLEQMLGAVTEYSRYACIETLRQGFLPLRGGFRLGVCGSAVVREGEVNNLKDISSLALRIVCEHIGLGSDIAPRLFDENGRFMSTLLLSPPGGGKTTLLRDLVRVLSLGDSEHPRCAWRSSTSAVSLPCAARAGLRWSLATTPDVLSLCPKAVGILMVLRGMNPQVIAVDEITAAEDIRAMCLAANCGVGLLCEHSRGKRGGAALKAALAGTFACGGIPALRRHSRKRRRTVLRSERAAMLRLTGAALILGAALRLQRSLSVRGRLRRKTLRALANAFLSLESAVRSTLTPLPALLQELRCESEAAIFC